ncbi:hypothetical protein D6C91_08125 [Aureobasidium pullulans]|uniref:BTB domain-containing protein n=2 Tax=Aureobasidium pullulans TaxID=5580 RepID=A0A4S9SRC5_AURPU|nr:hypothetical protein D6C91_08125 [Aureobasidium pullulans]
MAANMPEDKGFVSGANADPAVFNNPQDSDIILKVGETQFYAHRVVLRMWSPFFKRTFNSQFSVAKSAIFDFGDEEESFWVSVMLKHMYGATYDRQILTLKCAHHVAVAIHIKGFIIADKYDCPSMRIAIIAAVKSELTTTYAFWENSDRCTALIAQVCSPKSPQLADSTLRQVFMDWISVNYLVFYQESKAFRDSIVAGTLLDAQCLSLVLVKLSEDLGKAAT